MEALLMDGRRRQWIAFDVNFHGGNVGVGIRERFGCTGLTVFTAFLCACKRSGVQGQMTYTSDSDALSTMGLPGLPLTNEKGEDWTLDDLWNFLGKRHQVRRQRRGMVTDVISTSWDKWQRKPGRPGDSDETTTGKPKTSIGSTETTSTRPKDEPQTRRSDPKNTNQLGKNRTPDSNPDPDLDLDPDLEIDQDVDPDTRDARDHVDEADGEDDDQEDLISQSQGLGGFGVNRDQILTNLIARLDRACTGNHRPTVRSEAIMTIAVLQAHDDTLKILTEAVEAAEKTPPSLPRWLLGEFNRKRQAHGLPEVDAQLPVRKAS